jgi:hypothetical protein
MDVALISSRDGIVTWIRALLPVAHHLDRRPISANNFREAQPAPARAVTDKPIFHLQILRADSHMLRRDIDEDLPRSGSCYVGSVAIDLCCAASPDPGITLHRMSIEALQFYQLGWNIKFLSDYFTDDRENACALIQYRMTQ